MRLTLAKLDPWSVMKLGFLLSVAIGIAFVVLVAVLWTILDSMGVFADIDRTVGTVLGSSSGTTFDLMDYVGFGRVISLATVIAVIDVFLLTALATPGGVPLQRLLAAGRRRADDADRRLSRRPASPADPIWARRRSQGSLVRRTVVSLGPIAQSVRALP